MSEQEPYSAITAALSDLCDLTIQSNDYNTDQQVEIEEALGSDLLLLSKLFLVRRTP